VGNGYRCRLEEDSGKGDFLVKVIEHFNVIYVLLLKFNKASKRNSSRHGVWGWLKRSQFHWVNLRSRDWLDGYGSYRSP
jgi:hypothetical protein